MDNNIFDKNLKYIDFDEKLKYTVDSLYTFDNVDTTMETTKIIIKRTAPPSKILSTFRRGTKRYKENMFRQNKQKNKRTKQKSNGWTTV